MAEVLSHSVERLQGLRGMVDLLPQQTALWQKIENTARHHFKRAAIPEVRTPLLENTELFLRGIGESTDVVGKEMYSFLDRGNRNCTLRPEGTASVVRAAIQHGLLTQGPQKFWYAGPMFRYERPQAGRQRQFHQIGIEALGFKDSRSDVEVISIAWDLLRDLGLKGLTLEINSLGDLADRLRFRKDLISWLEERRGNLDASSQDRLKSNPLRILDSKNPSTQELLKDAPSLSDALGEESKTRFEQVKEGLQNLKIPFKLNPLLVRGLDYYTHTAFEITSNQLGAQATICGGGRYDGLIEQLGGTATPAIGWALGMERLVLLTSKIEPEIKKSEADVYIVNRGAKAESIALFITRSLRLKNRIVELDSSGSAFSKQLKRADKSGARWAIIIGDSEAEKDQFILKDLRSEKVSSGETLSMKTLFQRFS